MSTPATRRSASGARATPATATTTPRAPTTPTSRSMGRLELVAWLNRALRSDYASVQECGDGVAYAQLLDAMHPGKVPLHRFDFNARFVGDNERNVRVLAQTMRALGTRVDVDFDALAAGKFTVRDARDDARRRDGRADGKLGSKSRARRRGRTASGTTLDRIVAREARRLGFERDARGRANARATDDRSIRRVRSTSTRAGK